MIADDALLEPLFVLGNAVALSWGDTKSLTALEMDLYRTIAERVDTTIERAIEGELSR